MVHRSLSDIHKVWNLFLQERRALTVQEVCKKCKLEEIVARKKLCRLREQGFVQTIDFKVWEVHEE